ncbi:thiazole biosynthesis adenylyltransferase ThiF [Paenibacillus kribbensis]|uniref:thiazole biosynthesis adenylyltransferase ThiF n=1 Tax=Paenibacillus kribbensis TaxID=172713 RepID=UPI002DBC0332|nr:thiazole biosynthesis adenylyltransferase ThiF [Paenibacillus kribbensis]MEC0234814.1 thiazole biosynthesis adenylyltransferase ThiF [Paenibacillus kribbensis]
MSEINKDQTTGADAQAHTHASPARYSRQELFSKIGTAGQQNIRSKHVLMVGAGALGTANADMLVRAGIGRLTLVDRDYVDWSNLQRQQLYDEADARNQMPKAVAAQKRLQQINSDVDIHALVRDVSLEEIDDIAAGVDLIIDATDNFDIRLLMNDYAVKHRIPWIYGACVGSYGTTFTIVPGQTPCLHCLLGAVPLGGATCDTVGVISPAVQMVAAYQSAEALKLLTGDDSALQNKLITFDLWNNQHQAIHVSAMKKADCPTCGEHPVYPFLQSEHQAKTAVLCGRDTVQIRPAPGAVRDLNEAARLLSRQGGKVEHNPYLVSVVIGTHRLVLFQDGRVLVHGTKDIAEARSIYHKYLG